MRSFAVWCSTRNKEKPNKEVKVHINLWSKRENGRKNYCFDYGFLIEDIESIKDIFLYVPFQVGKNQIQDLGKLISNNKLVNAIFNENFTTTDGQPKKLIVNGPCEKPEFVIYSLEVENQIQLKRCTRSGTPTTPRMMSRLKTKIFRQASSKESTSFGTIIRIKLKGIDTQQEGILRYYFRLRIKVNSKDIHLINDEIKGVSIFSNQFTNTEVIDFRLNDVRSCSEELREQFNKGEKLQILAVHYLILRNANDEIVHYGKELNSRMLEKDLWKSYIDGANHNIIAYHIKSKVEKQQVKNMVIGDNLPDEVSSVEINDNFNDYIENFSDLTRFRYQKNTVGIIIIYVLVIIVFGMISGVIGNLVSHYIIGI